MDQELEGSSGKMLMSLKLGGSCASKSVRIEIEHEKDVTQFINDELIVIFFVTFSCVIFFTAITFWWKFTINCCSRIRWICVLVCLIREDTSRIQIAPFSFSSFQVRDFRGRSPRIVTRFFKVRQHGTLLLNDFLFTFSFIWKTIRWSDQKSIKYRSILPSAISEFWIVRKLYLHVLMKRKLTTCTYVLVSRGRQEFFEWILNEMKERLSECGFAYPGRALSRTSKTKA